MKTPLHYDLVTSTFDDHRKKGRVALYSSMFLMLLTCCQMSFPLPAPWTQPDQLVSILIAIFP